MRIMNALVFTGKDFKKKDIWINPAKALGIEKDYGSLAEGCYANILLLDEKLNLRAIFKRGKQL